MSSKPVNASFLAYKVKPVKTHSAEVKLSESPSLFSGMFEWLFKPTTIQGGRRKSKKVRSKRRRYTVRK